MATRKIATLKFSIDEAGELAAAGGQIALFAGFSKGMCEKIGTEKGMFTRCTSMMAGKVSDENAFCASLEKYCTGDWPAARKKAGEDAERIVTFAHSNAIRGVEVFGTGTHNGDKYTEADLDDMVVAFGKIDVRPALKIGHAKDKPGSPAYGWVTNLKRVGTKLIADFESMHDSVIEAIRNKSYDRVSSEIYFNLKRGGETFRRALKAVALLGAEVPAVAGLTPLHKVEFAAASGFDNLAECEARLDVSDTAVAAALSERLAAMVKLLSEKEHDAMTIKELSEKKAALEAQIAEMAKKGDKMDDKDKAELKQCRDDLAAFGAQIATLEQAEKDAGEAAKAKDALVVANARIAALEKTNRERDLKAKVAAITVPAFRPILRGLIEHALEHPETKLKVYAADKDGKETSAEKPLIELADGIVAQINAQAEKLFKAYDLAGISARAEGPEDGRPDEIVAARVAEYQAKNKDEDGKKVDYETAMVAVLKADPELAKRYETERGDAAN